MATFSTLPTNLSAAAYVRMSTDQQELSVATQLEAIRSYAAANGLSLLRIYEDAARSGLSISNRAGMKQLLRDVLEEPRPFGVVLVYDVSRRRDRTSTPRFAFGLPHMDGLGRCVHARRR